jgi:hypothetical protein
VVGVAAVGVSVATTGAGSELPPQAVTAKVAAQMELNIKNFVDMNTPFWLVTCYPFQRGKVLTVLKPRLCRQSLSSAAD